MRCWTCLMSLYYQVAATYASTSLWVTLRSRRIACIWLNLSSYLIPPWHPRLLSFLSSLLCALTLEWAINHTCLAVDGRKVVHQPPRSANNTNRLTVYTTLSTTLFSLIIPSIKVLHLSLLVASRTGHQLANFHADEPDITAQVHAGSFGIASSWDSWA